MQGRLSPLSYFYWCVNRAVLLGNFLRPVENPMASAEAGWCWRGAGRAPACEFARDPLCWIRNGCQKELDSRLAWHLGCLPDPLVEGTMAIMLTKKFLLRRRRACVA